MNNEVLRLHERGATDYETGTILNEAYNIENQRKINEIACLEFDYPMDEKARLIQENMLVSCTGRIYEVVRITRKMDGRDIVHITCEDMFSYKATKTFLPNVPDMIGKKTSVVIKKALEKAVKFSLYTNAELEALGMEWVGNDEILIDFFSTDKTNLWDFLQSVIENCGRGEIYSNGYKFALVERIGCDRCVRLTLDKNMQNIDIERSTEDIITKLYPFGADDLTVKHAKIGKNREYGKEYILSPNAKIYGVHEGCRDYSDYREPEKVLANALWEFNGQSEKEAEDEIDISEVFKLNGNNDDRIDVPKLTITGRMIDLSKLEEYGDIEKAELGDTVHVYDVDGNEYAERVIEGTWHPFEPTETTISIGHMRRSDIGFLLYRLKEKKRELEAVQTTNKQITTRKIQGVVNSNRNPVKSENEKLLLDGDCLVINDPVTDEKRLELGNVDGQFTLNIYSEDGNTLKIKLGDHGSNGTENYAFAIYDDDGNPVMYMGEDRKFYFAGNVKTTGECIFGKDCTIGNSTESVSQLKFKGMVNESYIENNDIDKIFKIVPSYCKNNLMFDMDGIKIDDDLIATQKDIKELWNAINNLNSGA